MRSDRRWRAAVGVVVAVSSGAALAACSGSEQEQVATPTEGERAACDQVQALVDAVASGESLVAMSSLSQMELALGESGNETLSTNGREFFETISDTVPDPGSLTVEQSAAVGDQALAAAQPRLGALLDECSALGLPITNLPTGDDRP